MNTGPCRFDNYFHDIALRHRGTAQPDPPLLMWPDVINRSDSLHPHTISRHMDFFALYIVQCGHGTHVIEGKSYSISRGDVYVMGPDTSHYFIRCENLIAQGFYFTPFLFDEATYRALADVPGLASSVPGLIGGKKETNRAGRWLHLTSAAYEQVADEVAELHAEWEAQRPGGGVLLRGLFTRLLIHLARFQSEAHPAHARNGATPHSDAVTAAIHFMEEWYAEPLRIEQVAAALFLSRHRLTRLFREEVGQTPRAYLRHIRIERAKALLESTRLSLAAIAEQSGFGEPAYFSRAFRAAIGLTPGEHRRSRTGQ